MAGPASVNPSVDAFNDDMFDALCHSLSQTQHILKTISSFKGITLHQMAERLKLTVTSLLRVVLVIVGLGLSA